MGKKKEGEGNKKKTVMKYRDENIHQFNILFISWKKIKTRWFGFVPSKKIFGKDPDVSDSVSCQDKMQLYDWFMDLVFPGTNDVKWYNTANWCKDWTPGVGASYVPWRTFTLTHIDYPEGDLMAQTMAILSLTPLVIVIVHLTVFACQRDLHTFFYGLGMLLNLVLNYGLKHYLKQPRPNNASNHLRDSTGLNEEYGMPSCHSQFILFFSIYMLLFVKYRLRHCSNFWRSVWVFLCLCNAAFVSYGRIYLHYHDWSQVIWGSAVGAGAACAWFIFVHKVMTPNFPRMANWRLSKWLQIRDITLISNIMAFEYASARETVDEIQREMDLEKGSTSYGDISADDEDSETENED